MIRAGARGYVTKSISGADLADAVRRVHGGDAVFSPRLAGFVLDAFAGPAPRPTASSTRSRRASARCCSTSPAATCTRRSPCDSTSRRRPWRRTCPRCCASSSSRAATSCRAGRRSGGSWTRSRQVLAQHLAGRAQRDLVAELHALGHLVVGQALAAVADQLALTAFAGGHHHGLDRCSPSTSLSTPTTTTSSTFGCTASTSSTSIGSTLSPAHVDQELPRPVMKSRPSSSTRPRSPEAKKPVAEASRLSPLAPAYPASSPCS